MSSFTYTERNRGVGSPVCARAPIHLFNIGRLPGLQRGEAQFEGEGHRVDANCKLSTWYTVHVIDFNSSNATFRNIAGRAFAGIGTVDINTEQTEPTAQIMQSRQTSFSSLHALDCSIPFPPAQTIKLANQNESRPIRRASMLADKKFSKSFSVSNEEIQSAKQHPRLRYNLHIGLLNCAELRGSTVSSN